MKAVVCIVFFPYPVRMLFTYILQREVEWLDMRINVKKIPLLAQWSDI